MTKSYLLLLAILIALVIGCEVPPPPDGSGGEEATTETITTEDGSSTSDVVTLSEAVMTSQGAVVRFKNGDFETVIPDGFTTPGEQVIKESYGYYARYMARKGESICLVSWNNYAPEFFETIVMESFLNVARINAIKQMEGELIKEESFQYNGFPCRRVWMKYPDDPPAPETKVKEEGESLEATDMDDHATSPVVATPREVSKWMYSRYGYIISPPYLFQLTYTAPTEEELASAEVEAFFNSFRYNGPQFDPRKYE